jgi:hypothetical protein
VEGLAGSISAKTGIDDEAIQSGQNLLLTFTEVQNRAGKGNDIFNQTTKVMTDMSAALGQDTKASAMQLGKALNDPVKGVTALQRVGVTFTKQQKKQIEQMQKHGDVAGAQGVILKELNKEFGGSAEAQATASGKLKNTIGNLEETIGGGLAPVVDKTAGTLNDFIVGIQNGTGAGGKFAKMVKGGVGGALNFIKKFIRDNRTEINNLITAFENIGKGVKWVFMNIILPVVKRVMPSIVRYVKNALKIVGGIIKLFSSLLRGDWKGAWDAVKQILSAAWDNIKTIIELALKKLPGLIWKAVKGLGELAGKGIKAGFEAGIKGLAGLIKSGFDWALNKAIEGVNWAIDKVNWLIDQANKLNPFGDIGKLQRIPAIGGATKPAAQQNLGQTGHLQFGGWVPGVGRGDRTPAMLEPREFVVRRVAAEALGPANMAAINNGQMPGGDIVIRNQMVVDGRVLAESTARHTADKRARR